MHLKLSTIIKELWNYNFEGSAIDHLDQPTGQSRYEPC